MEHWRFDALTRRLATAASRRSLLAGIASALAALVAPGGTNAACPPDQVARRGPGCVCKTTGRPPTANGCPCPRGQVRCPADGSCRRCCDDADCAAGWCDGSACRAPRSTGAPCDRDGQCASDFCCAEGTCGIGQGGSCDPAATACCGDLVCADLGGQNVCRSSTAPLANSSSWQADEGVVCLEIVLTGSDPDGDPLTFSVTSLPVNGQLFAYDTSKPDNIGDAVGLGEVTAVAVTPTSVTLCYQPSRRFFHGTDAFTFTVTDPLGLTSPEAAVSIVINDVN
jgi:hypothetical protein